MLKILFHEFRIEYIVYFSIQLIFANGMLKTYT